MKLGCLIKETGHASHSTDDLADCDLTKLCVSMLLLEVVENLLFVMDSMFHLLLEGDRELSLSCLKRGKGLVSSTVIVKVFPSFISRELIYGC